MVEVSSSAELMQAVRERKTEIVLTRSVTLASSLYLSPEVSISAKAQEDGSLPRLIFSHSDGLILSGSSQIKDMILMTRQDKKAIQILAQQSEEDFGQLILENLKINGQVSLIFRAPTLKASVKVNDVHVINTDTRAYLEQPQKYGVNVLQGAFTLYNFNPNQDSEIEASIKGLTIGLPDQPVWGSGVFISGFGDQGSQVHVDRLQVNDIYSTGVLPQGVADYITAGMFISYGALVDELIHDGVTMTYGVNDMVLDAWGKVQRWIVNDKVVSYGPSGVGFVNFGQVDYFEANASIETYGTGARAYNQYDGYLKEGLFSDIMTHNDGAVGIQISKKVDRLRIRGNIHTFGSLGQSLVKGVNVDLPAYAFSLKEGGALDEFIVEGDILSEGDQVTTVIMEEGAQIGQVKVAGRVDAKGQDSQAFSSQSLAQQFEA